jgi:hypothetical protein
MATMSDAVYTEAKEALEEKKELISSNKVETMEDYKYEMGFISGLKHTIQFIEGLREAERKANGESERD